MHPVHLDVVFSSGKQSPQQHFYFALHGYKNNNNDNLLQIYIKEKNLNPSYLK